MKIRWYILPILLASILISLLPNPIFSSDRMEENFSHDSYIHALNSLIFYLNQQESYLNEEISTVDLIDFSDKEVKNLWSKARKGALLCSNANENVSLLALAYRSHKQANADIQKGSVVENEKSIKLSYEILSHLLEIALDKENKVAMVDIFNPLRTHQTIDPNIENNPHLTEEAKNGMHPYLLPNGKTRKILDSIFLKKRVTENEKIFLQAGFEIIATGPRSYIIVAKHQRLRGYLVKGYLDTELRKKFGKESWKWLIKRCEGATKIRDIIRKQNIRYFVVPDKSIYCLPANPSPPTDDLHTRHLAILLVTDMQLISEKDNLHAWSHIMTKTHLNELYEIICRAQGSSYRPDNIAYTENHQFAFIDTEYPSSKPDFKSPRHYLNSDMRNYWDFLIKNGGPKNGKSSD